MTKIETNVVKPEIKFIENEITINISYSGEYENIYFKDLETKTKNNFSIYCFDFVVFNPKTDDESIIRYLNLIKDDTCS